MFSEKTRRNPHNSNVCILRKIASWYSVIYAYCFPLNNFLLLLLLKGIFVTRVQPEGPASKLLQPGDKIIQVTKIHLFIIFFTFYFVTNLSSHQEIIKCLI